MCYVVTDPRAPIVGSLSYPETNGERFPKSRRVDFPATDASSRERRRQAGMAPHLPPGANVFQCHLRGLRHGIRGPAGDRTGVALPQAQFGSPS